jgi:hypothetical protein
MTQNRDLIKMSENQFHKKKEIWIENKWTSFIKEQVFLIFKKQSFKYEPL